MERPVGSGPRPCRLLLLVAAIGALVSPAARGSTGAVLSWDRYHAHRRDQIR